LRGEPDLAIELVKGDRGVFDVRLDGRLIFSKRTAGRFPTPDEIRALVWPPPKGGPSV
jgi:selT/selW/selH-like putative selenoprotein